MKERKNISSFVFKFFFFLHAIVCYSKNIAFNFVVCIFFIIDFDSIFVSSVASKQSKYN